MTTEISASEAAVTDKVDGSEGEILASVRYDDAARKRMRKQALGMAVFIVCVLATVFAIPFVLHFASSLLQ